MSESAQVPAAGGIAPGAPAPAPAPAPTPAPAPAPAPAPTPGISPHTIEFRRLGVAEQERRFAAVARRACPLWAFPPDSTLTLLNLTENATFRVDHRGMEPMCMRVHRLDYAQTDSIRTEIAWILYLRAHTDVRLATPLLSSNGRYVESVEAPEVGERRNVVCFSFEPGSTPRDSADDTQSVSRIARAFAHVPTAVSRPLFRGAAAFYDRAARRLPRGRRGTLAPADQALYRRIGRIAATLHVAARGWTPPPYYQRIEWDWDATFGRGWNNLYGFHYWQTPLLSRPDVRAIDRCARLMRRRLSAFGTGPARYGMIHSDLRLGNLLANGPDLTVVDFDDCGRGWFLYDIAGIVGFSEHRPDLSAILRQIVAGYRTRAPLSAAEEREIPTFVMMRRIGLLEAMLYHLDNVDTGAVEAALLSPPIAAFFAKGTARLAHRYTRAFAHAPLPPPDSEERDES